MLEKAKDTYRENLPKAQHLLEEGKAKLGEAAVIGKEKLSQAATLAGPTYRQTMPEVLGGGYPVKPAVIKDESGNTISETHQQPGLIGLMKQTITEVIPEMMGLKSIPDESEMKQVKQDTTQKVDRPETSEDITQTVRPETSGDIQELRVTEEIRKIDMDQTGNVTQVEGTKTISHVPVSVKEILVKPQQQFFESDFPINEQPVLDQPLADNYEFQGQSVPAPTHQKVTMPSPQIMTSPEVEHTQQYH
jgi:hypothetical protein